jgi:predicted nucleic acid-binding protein
MKAYLDSNVVSAIAKDDTPTESDALDRLLAARDAGKVELVTSELTLDEIKRYSGPARKRVERTFRLLEKVPIVRWDELLGMHMQARLGTRRGRLRYQRLRPALHGGVSGGIAETSHRADAGVLLDDAELGGGGRRCYQLSAISLRAER